VILFFYGTNDYLLKKKLKALKDKYKQASKGSFDLVTLEGRDLTLEKFAASVQAVALFATTRLVVIDQIFDAPREIQDRMKERLDRVNPSSVVVFIHVGQPDKRLGLFKALNKPKISQYFKPLEESKILEFIKKEAQEKGADFASEAVSYLAQIIGSDPWQLANEIEKLAVYRHGRTITQKDIDEIVSTNVFANTFALVDALVLKNKKKALVELEGIIQNAEPPLKVLGAINFQMRLIALIKDELERGTASGALASRLKVKPYPLRKSLPFAKSFSWDDLRIWYDRLSRLDEDIKTGKIIPEEALKELVLTI